MTNVYTYVIVYTRVNTGGAFYGKKLFSFRLKYSVQDSLEALSEKYCDGNNTELIERLLTQIWFLDYISENGKYPSGLGIDKQSHQKIKEAVGLIF